MKKTLEDEGVIPCKGNSRRYSFCPGNIKWSSVPGALRGVVGNEVGIVGGGHTAESLWGFVFTSVSTWGQEVPAAITLKSSTYWSC